MIEAHVLTYNEERLIWHYISHHLQFCDRIYVYDNYSTDNTVSIAKTFGERVQVKYFGNRYLDDREYLKVKNNCWKNSNADFVIVGDCDEFVYLDSIPQKGVDIIKLNWFDMVSDLEAVQGIEIEEVVRHGVFNPNGKVNMFNTRLKEIGYTFGAHEINPQSNVTFSPIQGKLLHFKYIGGVESLISRHKMYEKRMSQFNRSHGMGVHYLWNEQQSREYYDNIKANVKIVI